MQVIGPGDDDVYYELDRDNATWLRLLADRDYNGNVEEALNEALAVVRAASQSPQDAWAALERRQAGRLAAKRRREASGGSEGR